MVREQFKVKSLTTDILLDCEFWGSRRIFPANVLGKNQVQRWKGNGICHVNGQIIHSSDVQDILDFYFSSRCRIWPVHICPYLSIEPCWTTRGFPSSINHCQLRSWGPDLVPQALPGRNLSAADRTTAWPSLEPLPSGCLGNHDELQPAKKPFTLSLSLSFSFLIFLYVVCIWNPGVGRATQGRVHPQFLAGF